MVDPAPATPDEEAMPEEASHLPAENMVDQESTSAAAPNSVPWSANLLAVVQKVRFTVIRLLGPTRNKAIAGAIAIVLVGGTITVTVESNLAAQHNAVVAASARAKAKAKAEKRAAEITAIEAEAAAVTEKRDAFDSAKLSAQNTLTEATTFLATDHSWADPAVVTGVSTDRDVLLSLITTTDVTKTQYIIKATVRLSAGIHAVPTLEEHQDEVFIAAEAAAGNPRTDTTYAISTARDYCTALLRDYPDVNSFVDKFAGVELITDYRRVAAYCPAYLPAMDKVGTQIPGDGGYSVAATGTGYGSDPRVLAAETYGTLGTPSNCYWEVNDSHGNILRNNFIMAAPGGVTIRVAAGQGFTTQGCGWWERR